MLRKSKKAATLTGYLLIIFYIVGITGLLIPSTRPFFEKLTPLTLFLSFGLLLFFHQDWNKYFLLFLFLLPVLGFTIELIGIKTGIVFGNYEYGPTLGAKLSDVPILIGINWFILIYITGGMLEQIPWPGWLKPITGAMLLVVLDLLIEPVAVKYNFWQWERQEIPIKNYWGWFIVSYCFLLLFYYLPFKKTNYFLKFLFFIQWGFFFCLWIFN